MTLTRCLLALPPFILLGLFCDTWADVLPMMVGGLFITIPYLLAWWLSHGFANLQPGPPEPHMFNSFETHGDDRYGYEMARYQGGAFSPMYGKRHNHHNW